LSPACRFAFPLDTDTNPATACAILVLALPGSLLIDAAFVVVLVRTLEGRTAAANPA
jgi:hypothetical protein